MTLDKSNDHSDIPENNMLIHYINDIVFTRPGKQ
jgi:hypothetical protein